MSINRWMDKEAVVNIYSGILLSHKKEHIWVSSNEVDEPRAYYTEQIKAERKKQISYISKYIWNLFFSFWLTSLYMISSRFIYLIRTDSKLFLFITEQYSIVYMHHSFFILSFFNRHLVCFHILAIVNNAAMNIVVHVSLQLYFLNSKYVENILGSFFVNDF